MKGWLIMGVVTLVTLGFVGWAYWYSTRPLPGIKTPDEGRGHVPIGEKIEYHSNPPTSGKHYEEWVKKGVYEEPRDDRYLVHSLEHGYVILSYNCLYPEVDKEFNSEVATDSAQVAPTSESTKQKFSDASCKELTAKLSQIKDKEGGSKIIVVPRPNLDAKIALTGWDYLDKFNEFDEGRIRKFIQAHINKGPELTMEP